MTDTGIFCSGGHVVRKAGANASATSTGEVYTNDYIAQAESFINAATRKNWSDVYGSLNSDVKAILTECASNFAAVYAINYDMSGFPSRADAELMMKVLYKKGMDSLKILMDQKTETFMIGA